MYMLLGNSVPDVILAVLSVNPRNEIYEKNN